MIRDNSRQSFLGVDSEDILSQARVGIVGLCGGGSHVAQQLAHIGVGHFVLCDPDQIDPSNLNRMVGAQHNDIKAKRSKTDIVAREIQAINPDAHIQGIASSWQEAAIELRDCIALFGCVDSYLQRSQLEAFCRRFLIPYFDIGMDVAQVTNGYVITGQAILSMPGMPCMRCMGFITDAVLGAEAKQYGAAGGRPQVVWPNGTLASILVGMFVAVLSPWNKDLVVPILVEYDGNAQHAFPSNRLAVLSRHVCTHYASSHDVGDPFFETIPSQSVTIA